MKIVKAWVESSVKIDSTFNLGMIVRSTPRIPSDARPSLFPRQLEVFFCVACHRPNLETSPQRVCFAFKSNRPRAASQAALQRENFTSAWACAIFGLLLSPHGPSLRTSGLEKEVFGSVTSSFDVVFPPPPSLWHEAREIITAIRINRAASSICFRIRNSSRANFEM
jgi:hypothetical protein